MDIRVIELFEKYHLTPVGLLLGYGIIFVALAFILQFLGTNTSALIRVLVFVFSSLIWTTVWWVLRNRFPENESDKIGIIVSIEAENEGQKQRIKSDLVKEIRNLLIQHNLSDMFEIVILNEHQSAVASPIFSRYSLKKDKNPNSKEVKSWEKIHRKIRGHFYIWGTIKQRMDQENKYFLSLNGLVTHRPIPEAESTHLSKEFRDVLPRNISFYEKIEFHGFKFSAKITYLAARYIIGLAALHSGDPFTAFKLHNGLDTEFKKINPLPKEFQAICGKTVKCLAFELFQQARVFFSIENDLEKAAEYIDKALEIDPNSYDALVFKSLTEFVVEGDPESALRFADTAQHHSDGDFTWLYNKAFLHMYLEEFEEGVGCYDKIGELSFKDEERVIDECIDFNKQLVIDEPDKIQCSFMLGFLYKEKLGNYPMALEHFEKFENESSGKSNHKLLFDHSRASLAEIRAEMNIENGGDTE